MSEAKFTKGPWVIDYRNSIGHIKSVNKCHAKGATPTVARYDIRTMSISIEERQANAHLIAAAPKMYDLLVKAKTALLRIYDVNEYPANGKRECDVVASEIDKLLTKVCGK